MFNNIGTKIKNVTVVFCVIGIIVSVICGVSLISQDSRYNPTATLGIGVLIGGSLASWLSSLFIYGFGELIEKTSENNEALLRMEAELKAVRVSSETSSRSVPAASEKPAAPASKAPAQSAPAAVSPVSAPVSQPSEPDPTFSERIASFSSAQEIYDYAVSVFKSGSEDETAFLDALNRSVVSERTYGNNKFGAVQIVNSYYKNGCRVFPVDRSGENLICPVCGKAQRSDRRVCASCSALFRN